MERKATRHSFKYLAEISEVVSKEYGPVQIYGRMRSQGPQEIEISRLTLDHVRLSVINGI